MSFRLANYLTGVSWQLAERVALGVLNTVVGVIAARHFGASVLGEMAWASSLIALFVILATGGLDLAVVRELTSRKSDHARVVSTAMALRFGACGLALLLLIAATWFVQPPTPFATEALYLILPTLLVPALQTPLLLLNAREEFGKLARLRLVVAIPSAMVRLCLLLGAVPAATWVAYLTVEAIASAALLSVVVLRMSAAGRSISPSWNQARSLLRVGLPEVMTGLATTIYLRIDQVMLAQHVTTSEIGEYSVAARLIETSYIVPVIATGALAPILFRLREQAPDDYTRIRQHAHGIAFGLSVVGAAFVAMTAEPICRLLYGDGYPRSGAFLSILAWTLVFVSLSVTTGKSIHAEGLVQAAAKRAFIGAGLNVLLNQLLIPRMGAQGAAIASIISYWAASHLAYYVDRRTRHFGTLVTRSPVYLVGAIRDGYSLWKARRTN